MTILYKLWYTHTISGNRLGATIVWNAMYHLECRDTQANGLVKCRVPSFHRGWAMFRDVQLALAVSSQ